METTLARGGRCRIALLAVFGGTVFGGTVFGLAGLASGQAMRPAERRALRSLESAGKELARAGTAEDGTALATILAELDVPAEDLQEFETSFHEARDERASLRPSSRALKELRTAADVLAKDLANLPEDLRLARARTILRVDGENVVAHESLGHRLVDGRWRSREVQDTAERSAFVQGSVQRASRLSFEVETGSSRDALLTVLSGPCSSARFGEILLEGTRSPGELARILESALRACALSRALREGVLELPEVLPTASTHVVLLRNREEYRAVLDAALEEGLLGAKDHGFAIQLHGYAVQGRMVIHQPTEAQSIASCTYFLGRRFLGSGLGHEVAPALVIGHVHWLCLALHGISAPDLATVEEDELGGGAVARTRAVAEGDARERERRLLLARAGLGGYRSHLVQLVQAREDPPFTTALVTPLHELGGELRAKSTFVVEWLQLRGLLEPVLTASAVAKLADVPSAVEAVLGPSTRYEREWRDWFLPVDQGLVQILEARFVLLDEDTRVVLEGLHQIRRRAFAHTSPPFEVEIRPELSRGCASHARYLSLHPDQLDSWPRMHEESPDREGFDVEGAWAGMHSVVVPGVPDGKAAIDAWMASFYHRLPLLDPGLMGIGYAREGGIAVLDSGSWVAPVEHELWVLWPASGTRDVPRSFAPELPNPLPGEDLAQRGYPITLQVYGDAREWTLELRLGAANGPRVPADLLTPSAPRNSSLVPAGAYCLIPESTLEPAQRYTILARSVDGRGFESSFDTARAERP